MGRKHNVKEINLEITNIEPFINDRREGFIIQWSSKTGWGEYALYKEKGSNEWHADSECMDFANDKEFITKLMNCFIDKLIIVS